MNNTINEELAHYIEGVASDAFNASQSANEDGDFDIAADHGYRISMLNSMAEQIRNGDKTSIDIAREMQNA